MIDSHCHLDHEPLFDNLNEILNRAKSAGVKKILTICTSEQSFKNIQKILDIDEIIYGTYGIHPHEAKNYKITKNDIIENILKHPKLIGIGETGLDFYYNHSQKDEQITSFKNHIEASLETGVPIIVHSRNAENETYKILNEYKENKPKILMHCFTGSYDFFKNMEKLNSYFSASGIITFKNSYDLQKVFSNIPSNRLLVETDSPFLAPIPMRGKKNEPSFIKFTINKLAELKNMNTDEIINITSKNFENLFLVNES